MGIERIMRDGGTDPGVLGASERDGLLLLLLLLLRSFL